MKCCICDTDAPKGSLIMGEGFTCSEDCKRIAQERHRAFIDGLKSEPLERMPDALETGDFEHWSLKLAVHLLEKLTEDQRQKFSENNPFMLMPEQMSLELKDRIIRHIPKAYVSETESRGHDRMLYGGTYCFRQPVPKDVIVKACQKAQILK